MKATSHAVRDYPQQAIVTNDTITIVSKVGREKVGSFSFPLSAWLAAVNYPTYNSHYNRRALIASQWLWEDYERAPEQAERIIDAQVWAIEAAMRKRDRTKEESSGKI